jgi:hypothetical protein
MRQDTIPEAHPRKGAAGLQPAPKPAKTSIKTQIVLDIMVSKVLCDLPFIRNQPLKSADD